MTNEQIGYYSDLGATKMKLFEITEIEVGGNQIKIPITFVPVDKNGDVFKVKISNIESEVKWEELAEIFHLKCSSSWSRTEFEAGKFIDFITNKMKQPKEVARQIYATSKLFEAI